MGHRPGGFGPGAALLEKEAKKLYITDEAAEKLCYAVVMQAVNDYKNALRTKKRAKSPRKKEEQQIIIEECERFFRKELGRYSSLDGEAVIDRIKSGGRENWKRKWVMPGEKKA